MPDNGFMHMVSSVVALGLLGMLACMLFLILLVTPIFTVPYFPFLLVAHIVRNKKKGLRWNERLSALGYTFFRCSFGIFEFMWVYGTDDVERIQNWASQYYRGEYYVDSRVSKGLPGKRRKSKGRRVKKTPN